MLVEGILGACVTWPNHTRSQPIPSGHEASIRLQRPRARTPQRSRQKRKISNGSAVLKCFGIPEPLMTIQNVSDSEVQDETAPTQMLVPVDGVHPAPPQTEGSTLRYTQPAPETAPVREAETEAAQTPTQHAADAVGHKAKVGRRATHHPFLNRKPPRHHDGVVSTSPRSPIRCRCTTFRGARWTQIHHWHPRGIVWWSHHSGPD